MTAPARIQRSRAKGWRMPENTVIVDRSTKWGNPFIGEGPTDRAYVTRLYREFLQRPEQADLRLRARLELKGRNLACWCPPGEPCHADELLEVANGAEPC